MPSPTATFSSTEGDDVSVFSIAWPGGVLPDVTFTAPVGETRDLVIDLSDGPTTDAADYDASDTLATTGSAAVTSGLNTLSFGGTSLVAGTYDLQVDLGPPDGTMANCTDIGSQIAAELLNIDVVKIELAWSGAVTTLVATTSTDDTTATDDAWQVGLEWSCLLDLDPPDDVEDA